MSDGIRQFILDSLVAMRYDVTGFGDDTALGAGGADVESLALAELTIRVEDRFGVRFTEEEAEELAGMTIGEVCAAIAGRLATGRLTGSGTVAGG